MGFLHFFDEIDFDENGMISATKKVDINKARSNFVYLISKYNRLLLKSAGQKVPKFFAEELPSVLKDIESGKDFLPLKNKVLENCLPQVGVCANGSDFACISMLNELVPFPTDCLDKDAKDKFENNKFVNDVEKGHAFTKAYNKTFSSIINCIEEDDKKSLYSQLISHNRIALAAERISHNSMAKSFVS